ncbi:HhoA/HhoB/HtrA family serine endopeptidase [Nostoc sp. FACHB-110]|uniref:HhoA/HhoB/HtrA family serine endopeptidase n=1 Tax=Nostoc sp. FACHB-110 TaxID=2692834 RepID=UPI001688E587|nr:HhoA/HhoB/HtrA family serine endopeptidase [Nostoc sp. FACHB-110]MBD2441075.1 trypsin-like peptidase domain-containing protein [Nostoc sp. FACHB-110]
MKRMLLLYLSLLLTGCISSKQEGNSQSIPTSSTAPTISANTNANYITQVVQQVGPAVVRINSTRIVEVAPQDPFLERFLNGQRSNREEIQRGLGSGFIISADGIILTNAHVVANANNVSVVLKDGRLLQGNVVGTDPVTDVAVVKIKATGLPVAKLGNSDNLLPGEWAIAIGNPLGLNNTVTQGIISATERSVADLGVPTERVDFIQTDAAINPGNSGGPLLNAKGEVIGMNTAIIQGAQGLGFAIPINTAQRIANQLVATGKADHPYVGIQMAELTAELQTKINQSDFGFKVNQNTGIIILAVSPNSPASRAGLRPGDIIQSINKVTIQDLRQVQRQVEATKVGESLQITINRNGNQQAIAIKTESLPTRETN